VIEMALIIGFPQPLSPDTVVFRKCADSEFPDGTAGMHKPAERGYRDAIVARSSSYAAAHKDYWALTAMGYSGTMLATTIGKLERVKEISKIEFFAFGEQWGAKIWFSQPYSMMGIWEPGRKFAPEP
jgi:hypothetical protein